MRRDMRRDRKQTHRRCWASHAGAILPGFTLGASCVVRRVTVQVNGSFVQRDLCEIRVVPCRALRIARSVAAQGCCVFLLTGRRWAMGVTLMGVIS